MKMTRRVAMKAGLGTALSALSLSELRADELPHHGKEGNVAMSHHLDTPLAAKGPCHLQRLRRKGGKDEMTKASTDLQDLRRRIYVKVKAELLRRFWDNTFVCSGAKGPRLGTMD